MKTLLPLWTNRNPLDRTAQRVMKICLPAVFISLCCFLAGAAAWNNSETMDEPYHMLAGQVMVQEGYYDLNPEHPPLSKYLSGLSMVMAGSSYPGIRPVERLNHLREMIRGFMYENRLETIRLLRFARLPLLVILAGTLVFVFLWSGRLYGRGGAWISMVLLGCQPLLLGHAQVVHTDVAAALTWSACFYFLHGLYRFRTVKWVLYLGISIGLALLAKFSAVYLVLFILLAAGLAALIRHRPRFFMKAVGALVLGVLVLAVGYVPGTRHHDSQSESAMIDATMKLFQPGGPDRAASLKAIGNVSIPLAHYALGLSYVQMTNARGQSINFLFGQTNLEGFRIYFPVGFLLKSTFPFLLLLLLAFVRGRPDVEESLFILLPVFLYVAVSSLTSYNIGIRHLLPAYPLLAVYAGRVARSTWKKTIAWMMVLQCTIPLIAFPHYIAHFNLLAGGRWMGHHYLADSNLDWGQDWYRMAGLIRKAGIQYNDVSYVQIGVSDPTHYLPGSVNLLVDPRPRPYLVIPRQMIQVGEETLFRMGYRQESDYLKVILDKIRTSGKLVGNTGNTLLLYKL